MNINNKLPEDENLYYNSIETMKMQKSIWIDNPYFNDPVNTDVTAILEGDIYPFVHYLYHDSFALLCTKRLYYLNEIDDIIIKYDSTPEVVLELVKEGGFVLSCIDHRVLQLLTADRRYDLFFGMSASP